MTTTDLVEGRITSFRREQGFGLITLDDGREVKFDAGICTMLPEEGAAVRLRVGPAKWGGGWKALYVEAEAGPPAFLAAPPAPRSLEDQLAAVQREHLVSGLTEQIFGQLVVQLAEQRAGLASTPPTLAALLDAYYTADPARARSDGYVRRPGPVVDATSVLGELAALLPGIAVPAEAATSILGEVIELANAALRRAGDGRRVYELVTGDAWCAYLALASDRAARLAGTLPFATPPAELA